MGRAREYGKRHNSRGNMKVAVTSEIGGQAGPTVSCFSQAKPWEEQNERGPPYSGRRKMMKSTHHIVEDARC